jgi:hypothetical protein
MQRMAASRDRLLRDRGAAINNNGQWRRQPSGNRPERTRDISHTKLTMTLTKSLTASAAVRSNTTGNTKLVGLSG